MRKWFVILALVALYARPVINEDNARPSDWFTPTEQTQKMEQE